MTLPSLPASGSTNWYAHYTALDAAVRGAGAIHVNSYGADSTAIAAAFTAAAQITTIPDAYTAGTARPRKQAVVFDEGIYSVTATATIPQGVDVIIKPGAMIRVASSMGAVFDTALDVLAQDQTIDCQGIIDCNNLATHGIYLRTFATFRIRTPRIYSPTQRGIVLGDPASASVSYEAHVVEPFLWRPNDQTVPATSVGIHISNATDCTVISGSVNGYDIGVKAETGGNTFVGVHPWNYGTISGVLTTSNNPTYCFQETSTAAGNAYIGCIADTAKGTGFHMAGQGARLVGCKAFNSGATGLDNVMNGVDVSVAGAVSYISGLHVQGGNSSHRIAADIVGDLTETTILGTLTFDTSATTTSRILGQAPALPPDLYDSFLGTDGSAPAAARWTVTTGGGSGAAAVINTNRLRITAGATGGYSASDRVTVASALPATLADVDLLFQLEYGNPAVESYFWAGVRGSAAYFPGGSGYGLETSGSGGYIQLNKWVGGVKTNLHVLNSLTFASGSRYWFRLRVQGSTVSWNYWPEDEAELPQNSFVTTDTGVTAGGLVSFAAAGGSAAAGGIIYVRKAAIYAL